jgi:hypothetical protein
MKYCIAFLLVFITVGGSFAQTKTKSQKPLPLPSNVECATMANNTLGILADAVIRKNFTDMYKSCAKAWKQKVTIDQLAAAFDDFVKNEIDLTTSLHTRPSFVEKPSIDKQGVLTVYLKYPTEPVPTLSKCRYLTENKKWKLIGLDVQLK